MDGPLFGLFEALFHLQSKGFVRRTIVTVARQTLDFFVGSAVEDWVSKTLKDIRTPRTAANVVSFVDKSMWPNGAWYNQTKPEDVPALMREIAAADEITRAEVREALLNLGDRGGPLLGVLGARNYTRAALDFLAAARSDLMTRQIGLHVVEAVLDELFPEGRDDDVEGRGNACRFDDRGGRGGGGRRRPGRGRRSRGVRALRDDGVAVRALTIRRVIIISYDDLYETSFTT